MFGINKYLLMGAAALMLLLSLSSYTFYKLYVGEQVKTALLQAQVNQLTVIVAEKEKQIKIKDELNKQIDELLKTQRESFDKKSQELDDLKNSILEMPGVNDDAHPTLKKYFEGRIK